MKTENIVIRADAETKANLQRKAKQVGLTLSAYMIMCAIKESEVTPNAGQQAEVR